MIALFMIERDLQQAGMGISDLRSLGCAVSSTTSSLNGLPLISVGIVPADGSVNPWNLPMGDANSDMILLAYGTSANTSEGQSLSRALAAGGMQVPVVGVQGFQINDTVLVAESNLACTLGRVTAANTGTEQLTLDTSTGASYSSSGRVFNLGAQPRLLAYAVRNGSLTVCNFGQSACTAGANDPTIWVPVANDIVSLQAQYGVDTSTPPDGYVDAYCQAAGGGNCVAGTNPGPATSCDYARIGSVRLGLVTRSPQAEKTMVSPATLNIWEDAATIPTTTGPVWTVPDRYYRYRALTSIVALRNLQLMGAQSGC